jgi:hypothetical protein
MFPLPMFRLPMFWLPMFRLPGLTLNGPVMLANTAFLPGGRVPGRRCSAGHQGQEPTSPSGLIRRVTQQETDHSSRRAEDHKRLIHLRPTRDSDFLRTSQSSRVE